ncbi:hypothetical protein RFM41_26650 [Mesorhizobium sp. VK25A]|uniref:DUF2147 domain-containing protein n=1 Tax=Mesorhizobium vachelliae TaxID=3072309 RepID=A0ABU5AC51_9HYPH|nr:MULTISPECIES: hypothetical protein [unclassified Mesorhizobium]MDX8534760.1 hypothetical protein [Mesorhizobium sp. VK25D]MDX8547357.1 hypothetical protein [Mesorhizobium sp. VK25A]
MLTTRSAMPQNQSGPARNRVAKGGRLAAALVALAALLPVAAQAKMPADFIGKWSTDPARCEQVNGEVDMLEVLPDGLTFYEIGCEFDEPTAGGKRLRIAAQCYKGGSPMTAGEVELSRSKPDRISVSLHGFFWTAETPEIFQRCHEQ